MQPIYKFNRWVVEVFWGSGNVRRPKSTMYLDPLNGKVYNPMGELWAQYDNQSGQFRFMLKDEMLEPLPDSLQQVLKDNYSAGFQVMTYKSN